LALAWIILLITLGEKKKKSVFVGDFQLQIIPYNFGREKKKREFLSVIFIP